MVRIQRDIATMRWTLVFWVRVNGRKLTWRKSSRSLRVAIGAFRNLWQAGYTER